MSCKDNARDLYDMIGRGQMMEAFEKYYSDNVVVYEPTGETRKGKDAQRNALNDWNSAVEESHGGGYGAITSDEDSNTSMVESWSDVSFKGGGRMTMKEVAVQKWQDGQIVEERFYYDTKGMEPPQQ